MDAPARPSEPGVVRLKRRPQFLKVAGARRKWVAPGLIVQARRRPDDAPEDGPESCIRVGFTVSRKVGNAVTRNRVRRRLKAAAEEVLPRHAKGGYDFVLIGRAASVQRPFRQLVNDLETGLKRLKAYRRDGD